MGALDGKQLFGNRPDVLLVGAVDLVAPSAGLLVEIVPVIKLSSGQKVFFNEPEWPLHAAGSIGIADLMGVELKAVALGEGCHLRHGYHVFPRAAQDHDMRVVDHRGLGRSAEIHQDLSQKHLAVEALERRVELKKQHA